MKNRIKEAREAAGLSQRKLAELISVNNSLIALMETGKRNPTPRTLRDIAAVCGVRLEWLRDGELPMKPEEVVSEETASIMDELSKQYNLRDIDRKLVEAFLSLPPQFREGVVEYAQSLAGQFAKKEEAKQDDRDLDKKGEALKQSYIIGEKEKRLSGSSTGSTGMDVKSEA